MAYVETTGLLEIDRNTRIGRNYSYRSAGRIGLLERFLDRVRKSFASGRAGGPEEAPLARLSDHMLEDIGLTRAEALELDRRSSELR